MNETVNFSRVSARNSIYGFGCTCICYSLVYSFCMMLIHCCRCWDRGHNTPAWNTALLPEEQRLDTDEASNDYDGDVPSLSASSKKRSRTAVTPAVPTGVVTEDALTSLIQVSRHLMQQSFGSSQGTQGSMSSSQVAETHRADALRGLLDSARYLHESLSYFPPSMHEDIKTEIKLTGDRFLQASRYHIIIISNLFFFTCVDALHQARSIGCSEHDRLTL